MSGLLVVELGIDATNDDLFDQMRVMKTRRESGRYTNVVCYVRGFDADPRELYEVPEVRAFCRRLVSQGFVSYLDYSTTLPGASDVAPGGWGAVEVWMCGEGRLKTEMIFERDALFGLLDKFDRVLDGANEKADALLGPMK